MDLGQLRYFSKICEHRSFTIAAQDCEVSQPALSQQIAKLEKELGQPLFERNGRSIRLTAAGKILQVRAGKILELVEDAKRHIMDDGQFGTISLGAIPTIAPYLIPSLLQLVGSQFKSANFQIYEETTSNLLSRCLEGDVDVGIFSLPCHSKKLTIEPLFQEELLLALPAKHALAGKPKIRLNDLTDVPFIALGGNHCLGEIVDEYGASRNFRPIVAAHVEQLTMLEKLVGLGIGVSFVPRMSCKNSDQRIVYRSISGEKPQRKIAFCYNSHRYQNQLLKNFMKALREFAGAWEFDQKQDQEASSEQLVTIAP